MAAANPTILAIDPLETKRYPLSFAGETTPGGTIFQLAPGGT
jgi:hypothetical protein